MEILGNTEAQHSEFRYKKMSTSLNLKKNTHTHKKAWLANAMREI